MWTTVGLFIKVFSCNLCIYFLVWATSSFTERYEATVCSFMFCLLCSISDGWSLKFSAIDNIANFPWMLRSVWSGETCSCADYFLSRFPSPTWTRGVWHPVFRCRQHQFSKKSELSISIWSPWKKPCLARRCGTFNVYQVYDDADWRSGENKITTFRNIYHGMFLLCEFEWSPSWNLPFIALRTMK